MIQVICDICGEASQKPFGFRPEKRVGIFRDGKSRTVSVSPVRGVCGTDRAGLNNLSA